MHYKYVSAIDAYCYFLADTVKDGNFEHVPGPADLEELLKPGTYVCVMFTKF